MFYVFLSYYLPLISHINNSGTYLESCSLYYSPLGFFFVFIQNYSPPAKINSDVNKGHPITKKTHGVRGKFRILKFSWHGLAEKEDPKREKLVHNVKL